MPKCNKERKSRSVNDIPIQKKQSELLLSLDEDDFSNLLEKVSQPSYRRNTPVLLPFTEESTELASKELSSIVKVCEKNLRDEDEAHQKREEMENNHRFRRAKAGEARQLDALRMSVPRVGEKDEAEVIPVRYDNISLDFIDDGAQEVARIPDTRDIEMQNLAGVSRNYVRGNQEHTPREFNEESSSYRNIESHYGVKRTTENYLLKTINDLEWPVCSDEKGEFVRDESMFSRHDYILPFHRTSNFSPFTDDVTGTDEIPNTTPHIQGYTISPPLPPAQNHFGARTQKTEDFKDVRLPIALNKIEAKRKKKKRENTYAANEISGYMGDKSLEEILSNIEGTNKKKVQGGLSPGAANDNAEGNEKQRRKLKDSISGTAVNNTAVTSVAIGNQQAKAPEAPIQQKEVAKTVKPLDSVKKISPKRNKGRGVESSPVIMVSIKSSVEDGEDEYMDANESIVPNQKKIIDTPVSPHTLDGNNYRADCEDVPRVLYDQEDEFITVANKGKKKPTAVVHQQTTRTGSTGKMERHSRDSMKTDNARRNSLEERVGKSHRRPATTSLGDFIDDKKCGDAIKGSAGAVETNNFTVARSVAKMTDSIADSYPSLVGNDEEMAACATSAPTTTTSPERTFSYADAAKKSSESSRETSPLNGQNLLATNATGAETNSQLSSLVTSGSAELPPIATSSSTAGLTFFYSDDDSQIHDASSASTGDDGALVLKLSGKTVRFAKVQTSSEPLPEQTKILLEIFKQRWEEFMNGTDPVRFKPNSSA